MERDPSHCGGNAARNCAVPFRRTIRRERTILSIDSKLVSRNRGPDAKPYYRTATYHDIDNKSLNALLKLYNTALVQFKNDADKTCEMMGGMSDHTNAETAALSVVANVILNLDEVVTKS